MSNFENTADSGWAESTHGSTERSFETPGEVRLRVENAAGLVEIETHDLPTTEVRVAPLGHAAAELASRAQISDRATGRGHEVVVEIPNARKKARNWLSHELSVGVWLRVPSGTELDVFTVSAPVSARGRYGAASIRTVSGAITVEEITGQATIRTTSGSLEVGTVGDMADVQSASGDVRIDVAGAGGRVSTASGDIALGRVDKPARVHTASGDVSLAEAAQGATIETVSGDQRIERADAGDYLLRAVSGDIVVAVVPGTLVRVDAGSMSGRVASDIDIEPGRPAAAAGADVREIQIQAKTVSGDVSVVRAAS